MSLAAVMLSPFKCTGMPMPVCVVCTCVWVAGKKHFLQWAAAKMAWSWWLTGPKLKQNKTETEPSSHLCPDASHTHKSHLWEEPALNCPPALCRSAEQPLYRSSWNPTSTNRTEAFPIQSELHSSGQSEWLYSGQLEQCLLDNQTAVSSFA